MAAGHPAASTNPRRHTERGNSRRLRPLLPPDQELQSQLDALAAHGIPREEISTRVRVRPKFEAALQAAGQIKAHAPHCRAIIPVYEMKRLGRDSDELTAPADHLTAHGIALEMLAGPLTGIYDPAGAGRVLFAFFAAMAETEREEIREATLEGLNAAAPKRNHGGRPQVITDDMLHTVLRRRKNGESLKDIGPADHPHRQTQRQWLTGGNPAVQSCRVCSAGAWRSRCGLGQRLRHIRPIFGEHYGDPVTFFVAPVL
ncbi:hypothetical protein D9M72_265850 [compost metagenome]